jgi:hypothetical protein
MNIFNKIFYNKKLNTRSWRIKGVETDPTQNDEDDNITINDKMIDLTISQEKGTSDIIATINVDNKEYSFLMYDEIINTINELKRR